MVMRYAVLVGAAAATIFGAINLSANGSNMLLVDAGQGGPSADLLAWVLGMVGAVLVLSFVRTVAFGLPSMMGGWAVANKTWLFAGAGMAVYAVFYLM